DRCDYIQNSGQVGYGHIWRNAMSNIFMSDKIEWLAVERSNKLIGAVGFIGNKAVAISAFYDDADGNMDGVVSWNEWLWSKVSFNNSGLAVTDVAMQARFSLTIVGRDPSFNQVAVSVLATFAQGLVAQGVYMVYFSQGISLIGSTLASTITASMIKQF